MFRSENPGRNPVSQPSKEAILELNGGMPVLLISANPGGMKFSPLVTVSS